MNNYCMIQNSKTFAFSAENPTGVRAGGSQGGDCTKLRPTVTIPAGETVTLVDAAGPGVIQHMWFTGYVGHHFIIRMYWDDQEYLDREDHYVLMFYVSDKRDYNMITKVNVNGWNVNLKDTELGNNQ